MNIKEITALPPWAFAPMLIVFSIWLLSPKLLPWWKTWLSHQAKATKNKTQQQSISVSENQKTQPRRDFFFWLKIFIRLVNLMAYAYAASMLFSLWFSTEPATIGSVAFCVSLGVVVLIALLHNPD